MKKRRIQKEDGRYLIFYEFNEVKDVDPKEENKSGETEEGAKKDV